MNNRLNNEEMNEPVFVGFTYQTHDMGQVITVQNRFDDDVPWTALLDRFADFLQAIGYINVKEHISVTRPFVGKSECEKDWIVLADYPVNY